ncbi:hypothetical protein [Pseudarthrobacter sp. NS4]|uniref:hypothetical protein n=1 Tax=Pseudarthrobacter sp. NS4 TaxID=2973976 RepID=UPI002162B59F|nr:hypothetical protein [Pseudarthrobacter sp. NS4]
MVSRADALFLMIASVAASAATTAATVAGIAGYFTGPVTLELPIATDHLTVSELGLQATGHYTALQATVTNLPSGDAVLLSWAAALNQIGILGILVLVFMLGYRLRSSTLFTAGSVWIVGACGAVLAVAATGGQVVDQIARGRLAEAIGVNKRSAEEGVIFVGEFDLTPLMAGLVLVLVACVFEYGRRLQKDAEGLV